MDTSKLTSEMVQVLKTLIEQPLGKGLAGVELMQSTRLSSGTLYPLLARSENAGLVEAYWEDEVTRAEPKVGRPRKYYRITGLGARQLHGTLQQLMPKIGKRKWAAILGSFGTTYQPS